MIVDVSSDLQSTSPRGAERGWPSTLRAPRPDRDVRPLLRRLELGGYRSTRDFTLSEARRGLQLLIKAYGSRAPVASVTERFAPGPAGPIRLRMYVPRTGVEPRPLLVWFHGGGFIAGDLYTAGGTARALANRSGAIVVAVEYRLAPEWDLDVGQADCLAAVRWVADHANEIGGDAERMAVGGDSAGGNLAAVTAIACARGGPPLRMQVLVYPSTDMAGAYPSQVENADGYFLTRDSIDWIKGHLILVSDPHELRFSPLHEPELGEVAPAVVVTAGYDPIRDEGLEYVRRLRAAGVPVHGLHYPGQIHGFLSFDRVLHGARDALERIGSALASAFAKHEGEERAGHGDDEVAATQPLAAAVGWSLGQRWHETIVASVIVRESLQRSLDALLERVWRFWNLPSASELDRLREQLAALDRRIERLRGSIAGDEKVGALRMARISRR